MDIDTIQEMIEREGIVFLSYGGMMSQNLVAELTEKLENEAQANEVNMGVATNIFTIFVELSQNLLHYAKTREVQCRKIVPNGIIIVSKDETSYYIDSQNILSSEDKEKITPKLIDVTTLDRDGIRKKYKELRRSGKDTHSKGGGLGFYEIAKRCDEVTYEFKPINHDKEYFHIRTKINIK